MTASKSSKSNAPVVVNAENDGRFDVIAEAIAKDVKSWRSAAVRDDKMLDTIVRNTHIGFTTGYIVATEGKSEAPAGSIRQADYAKRFASDKGDVTRAVVTTTTIKRWRTMGAVLALVGDDVKHPLYVASKSSRVNDAVREAALASDATLKSVESAHAAFLADKNSKSTKSVESSKGDSEADDKSVERFTGKSGNVVDALAALAPVLDWASLTPAERETAEEALSVLNASHAAWDAEHAATA